MKNGLLFLLLFISTQTYSQTFTNYTSDDGLINGFISGMLQDSSGNFWFVDWMDNQNSGIGSFDGNTWQQFGTIDGTSGNSYQGLVQDQDGNYWFGSFVFGNGLDLFDGNSWQNFTTADGLAGDNIPDIIIGNDGNLWMVCTGATAGLTTYDGISFTSIPADGTTLPESSLRALSQDANDTFWIASFNGVIEFDGVNATLYTTADGLSANEIEDILVDSNGIIWAGADVATGGGLNKYDGNSWTVFTTADGLPEDSIRVIFEDSEGNLWFGTNAGVSKYNGTEFINYDETDGLIENHVRSIIEDSDGNLWFGTWGGVSKFNPTLDIFDTIEESFSIAPNPAALSFQIQSKFQIKQIEVYNLLGEKILTSFQNTVDVSTLASGNYIVTITDTHGRVDFKKVTIL